MRDDDLDDLYEMYGAGTEGADAGPESGADGSGVTDAPLDAAMRAASATMRGGVSFGEGNHYEWDPPSGRLYYLAIKKDRKGIEIEVATEVMTFHPELHTIVEYGDDSPPIWLVRLTSRTGEVVERDDAREGSADTLRGRVLARERGRPGPIRDRRRAGDPLPQGDQGLGGGGHAHRRAVARRVAGEHELPDVHRPWDDCGHLEERAGHRDQVAPGRPQEEEARNSVRVVRAVRAGRAPPRYRCGARRGVGGA